MTAFLMAPRDRRPTWCRDPSFVGRSGSRCSPHQNAPPNTPAAAAPHGPATTRAVLLIVLVRPVRLAPYWIAPFLLKLLSRPSKSGTITGASLSGIGFSTRKEQVEKCSCFFVVPKQIGHMHRSHAGAIHSLRGDLRTSIYLGTTIYNIYIYNLP